MASLPGSGAGGPKPRCGGPFPWQQQSCQDQPRATSRGRRGLWARPSLGEGFPGAVPGALGSLAYMQVVESSPRPQEQRSSDCALPCWSQGPESCPLTGHCAPPCLPPSLSHLTQLCQASSPAWPWPPPRVTCPDLLGWLLSKPDIACPAWPPTGAPAPARSVAAATLDPCFHVGRRHLMFSFVSVSLSVFFYLPQWTVSRGSRTLRGVHSVARALLRAWLRGV